MPQQETDRVFNEELSHFPSGTLFDLARNPSASKEWRKAAVKLLLEGEYPQANHLEVRELRLEIEQERAAEAEVKLLIDSNTSPEAHETPELSAGFTTKNMLQDEIDE